MVLTQTKRGEEIERHRRDEIVIFRRADVRTVCESPGFRPRPRFSRSAEGVSMSLHWFQPGAVETLQRVFWFIGKSKHTARPVELVDAPQWPFAERECAEFIAVECVYCAWRAARSNGHSVKVISDSRRGTDAVRQFVAITSAIEELFPPAVGHENVFPLISQNHDFEIMRAGDFN